MTLPAAKVLQECIEIMEKKGRDYQNPNSKVKQAMYYPRGILSLTDMINTKKLRLDSLLESKDNPNFESIEDTLKDLINYAAFSVAFLRGQIDGQNQNRDMFNDPIPVKDNSKDFESYIISNYVDEYIESTDDFTVASVYGDRTKS